MNDVFLSIIVPVYNMELYLRRCLDSLLRQGLASGQYEVLMVNDGSTDRSRSICEEYARAHANFRLIDQTNQGVAAARNHGIDQSRGLFVGFVDADDYLLDNGLRLACERFWGRDDVDVIHYFSSYDYWPVRPIDNTVDFDGSGHDYILQGGLPSFCWLFLYRKAFLDRHHICFKPYVVGEDQLFSSTVCIANPHIVSSKADIYRYVVRQESATTKRSVTHTRRGVEHYLHAFHDILQAMEKYGVRMGTPVYVQCMASLNGKKLFGVSRMLSARYNHTEFKAMKAQCRQLGFYPVTGDGKSFRAICMRGVMNAVLSHYLFYKCVGLGFNYVFAPYVLPKLRFRTVRR